MSIPNDFVHLHNHSDYSLLDGAMKAGAMAKRAADLGQKALALTDHGNMFGAVEVYQACRKDEIKPIIGMEAYIAADRGLVIVNLDQPEAPELMAVVPLTDARASALQFRYLLVSDNSGLRVIDVADPSSASSAPG